MSTRSEKPHADRPLVADELAMMDDVAATESVPDEVAENLSTGRVHIQGAGADVHARRAKADEGDDVFELELPAGAFLGQAGRTGERLDRQAHVAKAGHTELMRPAWVNQTYQPRVASASFRHDVLQRINGKQLEPYYGIYGPDDRVVYFPGTYPWRCIGRIFTWTNWAGGGGWNWWGSGVLVGPRHVLTAGHVCPWGSGSWAMRFVPSYWNGAPALGAGAQSWTSDYRGWNTNDTVAAHDLAVLRLYNPIGSWLGWMGTKTYSSSWNGGAYWNLAGYPAAIAGGERPSNQGGIPVLDDDNDGDAKELEHHGDATGGDSGGPFFGFWNDGPYAVGVTSGGERIYGTPFGWWDEDNNIEAGGKAMVDLVIWAHSNWP
jgi:V8-like Glu-specific endopeptidase